MVSLNLSTVSQVALRAMAIGANLSRVGFGTWTDHRREANMGNKFYWKVELEDGRQLRGHSNNNKNYSGKEVLQNFHARFARLIHDVALDLPDVCVKTSK